MWEMSIQCLDRNGSGCRRSPVIDIVVRRITPEEPLSAERSME